MGSVYELRYVLIMRMTIGILAASFIHLLRKFTALWVDTALCLRTTLGCAIIGLCALISPGIMGLGYDTVNAAELGELGLWIMLGIVLFKIVATTACIGRGLPGGLIGPTLVISTAAGAPWGCLFPDQVASHGFYAMRSEWGRHLASPFGGPDGHAGADCQSQYFITRHVGGNCGQPHQQRTVW